jgi:putative Flp pilus-assembly TadE/G-like protein
MTQLQRRQPAQAMVLFALGLLAMVALLALVIDGSHIYLQRRTIQAAADAGALAGARALGKASLATIGPDATTFAGYNTFGGTQSIECIYLVDTSGAPFKSIVSNSATCPSLPAASMPDGASGVHVDVRVDFHTFLAGMLRVYALDAVGRATAQLATPGGVYTRDAPLIVCGGGPDGAAALLSSNPVVHIVNGLPDPQPVSLTTYTVSNNSGYTMERFLIGTTTIDPTKNGHVYYLKGPVVGQASGTIGSSTVTDDCGAASNKFDGGAAPDQVLTSLPGDLGAISGNNVAGIGSQVETPGGCATGTDIDTWTAGAPGCVMILPVADRPATGSSSGNPILHVETVAAFYVWCNKGTGSTCQEWVGQLIVGDDVIGNLLTNISISNNSPPTAPVATHLTQ